MADVHAERARQRAGPEPRSWRCQSLHIRAHVIQKSDASRRVLSRRAAVKGRPSSGQDVGIRVGTLRGRYALSSYVRATLWYISHTDSPRNYDSRYDVYGDPYFLGAMQTLSEMQVTRCPRS